MRARSGKDHRAQAIRSERSDRGWRPRAGGRSPIQRAPFVSGPGRTSARRPGAACNRDLNVNPARSAPAGIDRQAGDPNRRAGREIRDHQQSRPVRPRSRARHGERLRGPSPSAPPMSPSRTSRWPSSSRTGMSALTLSAAFRDDGFLCRYHRHHALGRRSLPGATSTLTGAARLPHRGPTLSGIRSLLTLVQWQDICRIAGGSCAFGLSASSAPADAGIFRDAADRTRLAAAPAGNPRCPCG